jgi:hypothetical protein
LPVSGVLLDRITLSVSEVVERQPSGRITRSGKVPVPEEVRA